MNTNTPEAIIDTTAPESEEKPRSSRARLIGIFLAAVGFIVLLVVGVAYYAYITYLDPAALKKQVETSAGLALGLPVSVGEVSLRWPTITMTGMRVGDPASRTLPLVEIGMAAATPDFFELLSGKVMLESVFVSSVSAKLTRAEDGSVVLPPGMTAASGAKPAEPSAGIDFDVRGLPLRQLEIEQVRVSLDDLAAKKAFAAVMPHLLVKKSLSGTALPIDTKITVEGIGNVAIKGELRPPEKLQAKIHIEGIEVGTLRQVLPASVELPAGLGVASLLADVVLTGSGRLSVRNVSLKCTPDIDVKGEFEAASLSPLQGSATIALEPLPVKRLMELAGKYLPPMPDVKIDEGRLGGEVRFGIAGGEMRDISAWAKPQGLVVRHAMLPAPLKLAQGGVKYDEGRVEWEKLAAEIRGITVKSDAGKVDIAKMTGRGDLSIRLDMSVLTGDLKKFIPEAVLRAKPEGTAAFTGSVEIDADGPTLTGELEGGSIRAVPAPGMSPVKLDALKLTLTRVNAKSGTIAVRECKGSALGMTATLQGSVKNGADPSFDLKANATADLAALKEALPIENALFKKQARLSGTAVVDATIGGSLKKPQPAGKLELTNVDFSIAAHGVHVTGISGTAAIDPDKITIGRLAANIFGGKLAIAGSLADYLEKPRVAASGTLHNADLGEIRTLIASNVPDFPADLGFNGRADLDIVVKGSADQPEFSGNAVLAGAGLTHPAILRPIRGIVGPIRFDQRGLTTEGLQMGWGSSTVRLVGRMESWSGFKMAFQYDVQPLDLTDIGEFFLAGTGYRAQGSGTGAGKISGPIAKIVVDGAAKLPSGVFEAPVSKGGSTFKFPFTDLTAPFRFTDGILAITGARANLFSGEMTASGKVFVRETPIRFGFDTRVKSLQTQEFLATNTTMKNVLQGGLDMSFIATGTTVGLNSLDGASTMSMASGSYKAPPVAAQIFNAVDLSQLSSGVVKSLQGHFVFKNGRMNSDDLVFKSPFGQLSYKGSVGLDTTLDGTANLVLPREICQGSKVLRDLVGNQPSLEIPVGVRGSLLSPGVDLRLDKLLKKAAENKAKDALMDILGGKKEQAPQPVASGTTGAAAPEAKKKGIGDILGGELGKILGGKKPAQEPVQPHPAPVATAPAPAGVTGAAQPASSPVVVTGTAQPASAPAPVVATQPKPLPPEKQIKKELKDIEKDLKKLFKFK
ncbi:MAG TPA: AsmA-like C-terminal region-containing protein [Candidatus Ozemobacteraceae bacterium]|nr:AsmA-like C-terminal region-containing protein [Candidatus Ozemobacteraceae bacterium]